MPIHYALYKNEKLTGKDRYLARVHSCGTLGREDVIEDMAQSGTRLTRADIAAVWDLFEQTTMRAILNGWNVTVPLGIVRLSIRGVFEGYDDRFDAGRHRIVVQFKVDNDLQEHLRYSAQTKRIHPSKLCPLLLNYRDVSTGRSNEVLTPGRIGQLYGDRLKFDPRDPRQGLFVLGQDGSVTRVEEVAENKPHTLIFLVPPLPIGFYKLAVRAACSGGSDLDVGVLDDVLRVAPPDLLLEEPAGPFSNAQWLLEMGE